MTIRRIELARGAWGAVLLLRPVTVLREADHIGVDRKSLVVTRILGARQLTQAVLSGVHPSPEVLAMGVWVDAVHSLSAAALAGADRSRARGGLVDVPIAAIWAAAGHRDLLRATSTPAGHDRWRDALARRVLATVPGGRRLRSRADDARRRPATARLGGPVRRADPGA